MTETSPGIGPILVLDDIRADRLHLAALVLGSETPPPALEAEGAAAPFQRLTDYDDLVVWRARFSVPADRASGYRFDGVDYDLASDLGGDLHIGYVSCNGEEHGDLDRDPSERNVMWRRLCDQHRQAPMALLLHGGDQVYADEATQGHALTESWPTPPDTDPSPDALLDLRQYLRRRFALRYRDLYVAPEFAWIAARVPSLMQWDDHDICDGWGSLTRRSTQSSVGQVLFHVARDAALTFQQACAPGDLPPRFADPNGQNLGWQVTTPDFRIVAPDLRSQRTRQHIMGPDGWDFLEAVAATPAPPQTILMSSVPLLGPRLSLVETLMTWVPGLQKYEDDLRDQWQSRAHRAAWIRMLRLVQDMTRPPAAHLTAVSGEIHLATRAEMDLGQGKCLHQLVASGISHRAPPKLWARALGALASLGEDPIPQAPIRVRALPGQRRRYVAERNSLTLSRRDGQWSARWDLEQSGPTPSLPLDETSGSI